MYQEHAPITPDVRPVWKCSAFPEDMPDEVRTKLYDDLPTAEIYGGFIPEISQRRQCAKHVHKMTCSAYERIPEDIMFGGWDTSKPYLGPKGRCAMFEPKEQPKPPLAAKTTAFIPKP